MFDKRNEKESTSIVTKKIIRKFTLITGESIFDTVNVTAPDLPNMHVIKAARDDKSSSEGWEDCFDENTGIFTKIRTKDVKFIMYFE